MPISLRLLLGFFAGFLAHLIFQGAFGSILYAGNVLPALPFSLDPVPPFGVPKTLNLGFWAGLWGIGYAVFERQLTARFSWWLGGLVYGLAPLAIFWFAVLPLKGLGAGGGFDPAAMLIHVGFHEAFGIGLAIIFQAALNRDHRRIQA
jgi:hypothetical protein